VYHGRGAPRFLLAVQRRSTLTCKSAGNRSGSMAMHKRRSQVGRGAVCPFYMHFSGSLRRFLSDFSTRNAYVTQERDTDLARGIPSSGNNLSSFVSGCFLSSPLFLPSRDHPLSTLAARKRKRERERREIPLFCILALVYPEALGEAIVRDAGRGLAPASRGGRRTRKRARQRGTKWWVPPTLAGPPPRDS